MFTKMRATVFGFIFLVVATKAAVTKNGSRIMGGFPTTIAEYPFIAVVLGTGDLVTFSQMCAGSIINTRTILSAAHCFRDSPARFRIRVGSTLANSGGVVHNVERFTNHPDFRWITMDNDIALVRTTTVIAYVNNAVQPASFAGSNYVIADDSPVRVVGWGQLYPGGPPSEELRHAFIWTVNQNVCRINYDELGFNITENMICAGWINVGERGQCAQDSGGPLLHSNPNSAAGYVVIGVSSFNPECGRPRYPGINSRVSRYITWIQNNV